MPRKKDTMSLCRQRSADSKIATICISTWLLTAITERFCYRFASAGKKKYNVSKEEKNLIQHEIPMISILHSTCRDSVLQSCFLSNNDMSLLIFRDSNWSVVSNMNFIFHFI